MGRPRYSGYRLRKILAPAYGLRRYVFLSFVSFLILLAGIALGFKMLFEPLAVGLTKTWNGIVGGLLPHRSIDESNHLLGAVLMVLGAVGLYVGLGSLWRKLNAPAEHGGAGAVGRYRRIQELAVGPKIVAIGGGTGLSTLLRGLKRHSSNITAIVTVSDDGGSSGRLVQEMGIIPPGDIRNCLVALADAEQPMTDLFQHRFKAQAGSLSGHAIGNLLIAALIEQAGGDIDKALRTASQVLAIRGRVVPTTKDRVWLRAVMEDGSEICGETAIVASGLRIRRIHLDGEAHAHPVALESLADAELICIGPGSIYTSVVPNFLVPGIAEAVQSSKATKVYICNVMTQRGESDAFTCAEHLVAFQANVPGRLFDYVVVNTGVPSQATLEKYRDFHQEFVAPDIDRVASMGYRPVTGDFMSDVDFVRHDPARLAEKIMGLL
jgi:uncharacterized cofD-like protein